jgi:hypothetical protein
MLRLVYFVYLVDLVHLVSFVYPNKREKPDKPFNGLLTLAGFFSILPVKNQVFLACTDTYRRLIYGDYGYATTMSHASHGRLPCQYS